MFIKCLSTAEHRGSGVRHARMGRLGQHTPAARTSRQHASRRGRSALLCPDREASLGCLTQTKQPPENPGQFTCLSMDWPCMLSRLPCGRVRSPAAMGDPGGGPARPVRLRRGLLQPKPQCTQPSATSPRAGRETDGELTPGVRQNGRGLPHLVSARAGAQISSRPVVYDEDRFTPRGSTELAAMCGYIRPFCFSISAT